MMIHAHTHLWWHELNCHDVRAAIAFYGRVHGWKFDSIKLEDGSIYWIGRRDGVPVCGISRLDPHRHADVPPHWMTYMAVADIEAARRAALFHGGGVLREVFHVPGFGRLAVLTDPMDTLVGLFEPEAGHPLTRAPTAMRSPRPAPLPAE